jgi:hypothetical protein
MHELPPAIVDRVLKLVRMLSSSNANEAGAAAAALNRTLSDAGLSIHDFSTVVQQGFEPGAVKNHRAQHETPRNERPRNGQLDWRSEVAWCAAQPYRLSKWETDFLESLGQWRGRPTEKQAARLKDIVARLRSGR